MSKFGALAADTEKPFRVYLNDPFDNKPIRLGRKQDGERAYIDVLPDSGLAGTTFDREERARVQAEAAAGNLSEEPDAAMVRKRKTARLTRGWLLIDPETGDKLDVPCTEENARELYLLDGLVAKSIWAQVALGSQNFSNFIIRSPLPSSDTASTVSSKAQS